jgi:hypothetical protein
MRWLRVSLLVVAVLSAIAVVIIAISSESTPRVVTFCAAAEAENGDWILTDVEVRTYVLPAGLLPELNEVQPDKTQPVVPSAMVVRFGWNIDQLTGGPKPLAYVSYVDASTPGALSECASAGFDVSR